MPNDSEEKPDVLANSCQQFAILMTIMLTALAVVTLTWLIFGPPEGAS